MESLITTLATIGYEDSKLADFLGTLQAANITRLIDVRQLAMSRRPGFAKNALTAALTSVGIEYVHLKGLGDPKEGRVAARAGDDSRFRRVFSAHMITEAAQVDLAKAIELVSQGGACLMCYERNHVTCHRSIVAKAISDNLPASIRHLGVRPIRVNHKQAARTLVKERA
jgi:uncharacterized protein (DUF488 family)